GRYLNTVPAEMRERPSMRISEITNGSKASALAEREASSSRAAIRFIVDSGGGFRSGRRPDQGTRQGRALSRERAGAREGHRMQQAAARWRGRHERLRRRRTGGTD